jgi:hypothetical protein
VAEETPPQILTLPIAARNIVSYPKSIQPVSLANLINSTPTATVSRGVQTIVAANFAVVALAGGDAILDTTGLPNNAAPDYPKYQLLVANVGGRNNASVSCAALIGGQYSQSIKFGQLLAIVWNNASQTWDLQ